MNSTVNKQGIPLLEIDYAQLMDLRIDFAFKLLFTKGKPRLLISLLNATFANKRMKRVIKSLTIKNPYLEKESAEDKLSILDIRAELEDGTNLIIEMHMYGLGELKAKTIRSWARAFGEELVVGEGYIGQAPTIAITFTDGQVEPVESTEKSTGRPDKIHRLCMIMDCEDFTIFTDAMELHYIDMRAFAKAVNEAGSIHINDNPEVMFSKWLSIITQKEITDKTIITDVCDSEEEIQLAVTTLARQSKDKITRQAYQRRLDEIYFYNKNMAERDEYKRRAEKEQRRAEKEQRRAEVAESALEERNRALEERNRALEERNRALEEKDAIISQLKASLGVE